jgi:hypothetical protein
MTLPMYDRSVFEGTSIWRLLVGYRTPFFLRIIGNSSPLPREGGKVTPLGVNAEHQGDPRRMSYRMMPQTPSQV